MSRRKVTTSNDLIRQNCTWPMTVGEVAKLTGVTRRALQVYDERGLLCPARSGEDVANNRKLYMPEDIDRLKQIVVLKDYGFDLKEMPPILDGEVDVVEALNEKLEELRAQENDLKNRILFARYAQVVGDDIETSSRPSLSALRRWMLLPNSFANPRFTKVSNKNGRISPRPTSRKCGTTSAESSCNSSPFLVTTRLIRLRMPSVHCASGLEKLTSRRAISIFWLLG